MVVGRDLSWGMVRETDDGTVGVKEIVSTTGIASDLRRWWLGNERSLDGCRRAAAAGRKMRNRICSGSMISKSHYGLCHNRYVFPPHLDIDLVVANNDPLTTFPNSQILNAQKIVPPPIPLNMHL